MAKKVSTRLLVQIGLTGGFMIAEVLVGYLTNSLALISDSFHMLSDVLALIVALWARRFAKKDKSDKMTFGWIRAETVGALMNGVFLIAMCINLGIEAIQRFFEVKEITNPVLILGVGGGGLLINVIGLLLFSHGSHGHSHSHQNSSSGNFCDLFLLSHNLVNLMNDVETVEHSHGDMNVRGVFLHLLGDALGSVGVIATSLIIWLVDWKYKYYVDPVMSLIITAIILKSSIPLVRQAASILLQAVPKDVEINKITEDVLQIEDVLDLHEIHVWQLNDNLSVASLHITCNKSCNFMNLAGGIKKILHGYGIHATTIQPEFVEENYNKQDSTCLLKCQTASCEQKACCKQRTKSDAKEKKEPIP